MAKPRKSSPRVGYKNPPRETRFRPGRSGNPRGRPKGSRNLATVIQKELRKTRVQVTERDGISKMMPADQAIAKQHISKALKGDSKTLSILLKTDQANQNQPDVGSAQDVFDTPEDKLVMASIVWRIRQVDEPPPRPVPPAEDPEKPQTPPDPKQEA